MKMKIKITKRTKPLTHTQVALIAPFWFGVAFIISSFIHQDVFLGIYGLVFLSPVALYLFYWFRGRCD